MVYRGLKIMYNVRNLCSVFWVPKYLVFFAVYLENAAFLIQAHPRCPPEGLNQNGGKKKLFL